jgi:cyclohexanone monooxygenase
VIRSVAVLNRDFQNACTPGYYNNEGGERSGGLNGQTYTPGINKFNEVLANWRATGKLEGLDLRYE